MLQMTKFYHQLIVFLTFKDKLLNAIWRKNSEHKNVTQFSIIAEKIKLCTLESLIFIHKL